MVGNILTGLFAVSKNMTFQIHRWSFVVCMLDGDAAGFEVYVDSGIIRGIIYREMLCVGKLLVVVLVVVDADICAASGEECCCGEC